MRRGVFSHETGGSQMVHLFWLIPLTVLVTVAVTYAPSFIRRRREEALKRARSEFYLRREWLEAEFLSLAKSRGLPRGLDWVDCDFDDGVAFARDRMTRELRALVAVTIRFEAIPGGGMEDVEAVGNLRAATVVFRYAQNKWVADGRALFNVDPDEAIQRYRNELETVD